MDVRTGEIRVMPEDEEQLEHLVRVGREDMTKKQLREMAVSLNDHRSTLGKKLTKERSDRGMTKNSRRKLRRKGLLR